MFKKQISLFLATFLIVGLFFLALPDEGSAGMNFLVCCTTEQGGGNCLGCGESGIPCAIELDSCSGFFTEGVCDQDGIGDPCGPATGEGCCVLSAGNCRAGLETISRCEDNDGIAWFQGADCSAVPQCQIDIITAVPTLSEWGLIAMVAVLGIVGYLVIRRRKVSA